MFCHIFLPTPSGAAFPTAPTCPLLCSQTPAMLTGRYARLLCRAAVAPALPHRVPAACRSLAAVATTATSPASTPPPPPPVALLLCRSRHRLSAPPPALGSVTPAGAAPCCRPLSCLAASPVSLPAARAALRPVAELCALQSTLPSCQSRTAAGQSRRTQRRGYSDRRTETMAEDGRRAARRVRDTVGRIVSVRTDGKTPRLRPPVQWGGDGPRRGLPVSDRPLRISRV